MNLTIVCNHSFYLEPQDLLLRDKWSDWLDMKPLTSHPGEGMIMWGSVRTVARLLGRRYHSKRKPTTATYRQSHSYVIRSSKRVWKLNNGLTCYSGGGGIRSNCLKVYKNPHMRVCVCVCGGGGQEAVQCASNYIPVFKQGNCSLSRQHTSIRLISHGHIKRWWTKFTLH
jgi:hypothetical protein